MIWCRLFSVKANLIVVSSGPQVVFIKTRNDHFIFSIIHYLVAKIFHVLNSTEISFAWTFLYWSPFKRIFFLSKHFAFPQCMYYLEFNILLCLILTWNMLYLFIAHLMRLSQMISIDKFWICAQKHVFIVCYLNSAKKISTFVWYRYASLLYHFANHVTFFRWKHCDI